MSAWVRRGRRRPARGARAALLGAILVAVASVLFTSCGAPAASVTPPGVAASPVDVQVLAVLDTPERLALEHLARAFEDHEGHRVHIVLRSAADHPSEGSPPVATGTPIFQAVLAAARDASPPQLAVADTLGLGELAASGRVQAPAGDVAPALARSLLPVARQAAGDEVLLALPLDLDVDVLYVRRGLIYQAPATWEALTGVSRASTAGGRQAGPLAVGQDDTDPVVALATLASTGGAPPAGSAAAPADALSGPAGQAAAASLARWARSGDIRYAADPVAEFSSGSVGLALAPASALGRLETALGGHATFQVSTLPAMPARPRFAVLLPYGPAPARREAARFLQFLAEPENQAFWAVQTGRLPAVQAAYVTAAWRDYTEHHPEVRAMADAVSRAPAWSPGEARAAEDAALVRSRAARGLPAAGPSR